MDPTLVEGLMQLAMPITLITVVGVVGWVVTTWMRIKMDIRLMVRGARNYTPGPIKRPSNA